jgi:hypothetical protein
MSSGCCGKPISNDLEGNRKVEQYHSSSPISQQPGRQPGLSWEKFGLPSISSPSPTYPYGSSHSPPLPSIYNGFSGSGPSPAASSSFFEQSPTNGYRGGGSPPPLRPNSGHGMRITSGSANRYSTRSGSLIASVVPIISSNNYVPPSDEGKLSVSIDFGGFRNLL